MIVTKKHLLFGVFIATFLVGQEALKSIRPALTQLSNLDRCPRKLFSLQCNREFISKNVGYYWRTNKSVLVVATAILRFKKDTESRK